MSLPLTGAGSSAPGASVPAIANPSEISNLAQWYSATLGVYEDSIETDPAEDGDDVSSWSDQAGAAKAYNAGAGKPNYQATGMNSAYPTIHFDRSVPEALNVGNTHGIDYERDEPFSCSMLVQPATVASIIGMVYGSAVGGGGGEKGWSLGLQNSKAEFWLVNTRWSNAIRVSSATTLVVNTPYRIHVTYSGSSAASGVVMYINDNLESLTTQVDNLSATTVFTWSVQIGTIVSNPTYYWDGLVSEIIIYGKQLNATEITQVDNWIKTTYGLS